MFIILWKGLFIINDRVPVNFANSKKLAFIEGCFTRAPLPENAGFDPGLVRFLCVTYV